MLDELKTEEFEKRVFHKQTRQPDEVNVMDTYEFRAKRKKSKNPLVWKPDRLRFSKDLQDIFSAKGMAV